MLRYVVHISNVSRILSWRGAGLCQRPFLHLMRWSPGFLSFSLFLWCIKFTSWPTVNKACISGLTPTWSWRMVVFLMCRWIQFASILLRVFASMCIWEIALCFLAVSCRIEQILSLQGGSLNRKKTTSGSLWNSPDSLAPSLPERKIKVQSPS